MEITEFDLKEGVTTRQFMATNEQVSAWVRKQPGFMGRFLTQNANGRWVDVLVWETEADAKQVNKLFREELGGSEFMKLLKPDSIETRYYDVVGIVTK